MEREEIILKALEAVLPYSRSTAALGTGVGKTGLGLMHMEYHYTDSLKVLVAAPQVSIFQSWKDLAKELNMEYLLEHIKFTTYLSLFKQDLDYDIVYLDEIHSLLDSHRIWLNNYHGKIVGLTGSPPRFKHSEKGKMLEQYAPVVFEYGVDDAIEDDILNDYRIIVHPMQLSEKLDMVKQKKSGGTWMTSEQKEYDYWTSRVNNASSSKELNIMRVMRMKALQGFKTKERYARELLKTINEKVIIFADEQKQAERLSKHSYHSGNPDSEANLELFKEGKIVRLSCVHQLSMGVNIKGLRACVVLHSYGNERKFAQRLGRMTRLNPDETATIHLLCYRDTADEGWVTKALSDFDPDKISWKEELIKP